MADPTSPPPITLKMNGGEPPSLLSASWFATSQPYYNSAAESGELSLWVNTGPGSSFPVWFTGGIPPLYICAQNIRVNQSGPYLNTILTQIVITGPEGSATINVDLQGNNAGNSSFPLSSITSVYVTGYTGDFPYHGISLQVRPYIGTFYTPVISYNGGDPFYIYDNSGIAITGLRPFWCSYNSAYFGNVNPGGTVLNLVSRPSLGLAIGNDTDVESLWPYNQVPSWDNQGRGHIVLSNRKSDQPVSVLTAPLNRDGSAGAPDLQWGHTFGWTRFASMIPDPSFPSAPVYPKPYYAPDVPALPLPPDYDLTAAVSSNLALGSVLIAQGSGNETIYTNRYGKVTYYDEQVDQWVTVATDAPVASPDGQYLYTLTWHDQLQQMVWVFETSAISPLIYESPKLSSWDIDVSILCCVWIDRCTLGGRLIDVSAVAGGQPPDAVCGMSFPTGGGSPRLHVALSRSQISVGRPSDWVITETFPSGPSAEFVMTVQFPVTFQNSAVRFSSSFDLGKTWSVGQDLGVKAADGTAITDGLMGTEIWTARFLGYYYGGVLNLIFQKVTYPAIGAAAPYKWDRSTSMQFLPDGSIMVNGVHGDWINAASLPGGTSDAGYADAMATLLAQSWQFGKRCPNDVSGRTGWRDASTSNADAGLSAWFPIWSSRGGAQGVRGGGGTTAGPCRIYASSGHGVNYYSDDGGDTWHSMAETGNPQQSGLWFSQGGSWDGANTSNVDYIGDSSATPLTLTGMVHPLGWTGSGAPIQRAVAERSYATGYMIANATDLRYGPQGGPGWNWNQMTILLRHAVVEPFGPIAAMIASYNAGQTWTWLNYSTDGMITWTGTGGADAFGGVTAASLVGNVN